MLAYRPHMQKRATWQRGAVICARCAAPVYVTKLQAVADEFSAQCKSCGHRGLYDKRAMNIEQLPERRKKPRA
ncbi:MAG TPA: hypothetical protein VFB45_13900 [Pseudolabrys sp.]|nr:hypothetical protein [Pseudolabrys sp.]